MVKISSLVDLVHFKAELKDLGLVYQVIPCTAISETRLVKLALMWHIMVEYTVQCRDMID